MAAPNLIGATTINGRTAAANLTSTSATSVLSNASSSGKCLKVNTFSVSNYTGTAANITVVYNTAAALGGTNHSIAGNISVPANSTLNVVDKTSQYYLEENTSLGAIAGTANALSVTISYEEIS
jgi:hypothetical protein